MAIFPFLRVCLMALETRLLMICVNFSLSKSMYTSWREDEKIMLMFFSLAHVSNEPNK